MVEQKSVPVLERERKRNLKAVDLFKHLRSVNLGVFISAAIVQNETLAGVGGILCLVSSELAKMCNELADKKKVRIENIYNRRHHPSVASEETS